MIGCLFNLVRVVLLLIVGVVCADRGDWGPFWMAVMLVAGREVFTLWLGGDIQDLKPSVGAWLFVGSPPRMDPTKSQA